MTEDPSIEARLDPCIATRDVSGVPYGVRLKRARDSAGKSASEVAQLMGLTVRDYDEWEAYEGELNMATSLKVLSQIARALGIPTSSLFDDRPNEGPSIQPEELSRKIREHLEKTSMSLEEFESRVGFEIAPSLINSSKILGWNLDCLRCLCKELSIDWRRALP